MNVGGVPVATFPVVVVGVVGISSTTISLVVCVCSWPVFSVVVVVAGGVVAVVAGGVVVVVVVVVVDGGVMVSIVGEIIVTGLPPPVVVGVSDVLTTSVESLKYSEFPVML